MKVAALLLIPALIGCAGKPIVVEKPVPVPAAKVVLPARPIYQSALLDGTQTTQQRLLWMTQDFTACRHAEEQYRTLLGPFATNPDPAPAP